MTFYRDTTALCLVSIILRVCNSLFLLKHVLQCMQMWTYFSKYFFWRKWNGTMKHEILPIWEEAQITMPELMTRFPCGLPLETTVICYTMWSAVRRARDNVFITFRRRYISHLSDSSSRVYRYYCDLYFVALVVPDIKLRLSLWECNNGAISYTLNQSRSKSIAISFGSWLTPFNFCS